MSIFASQQKLNQQSHIASSARLDNARSNYFSDETLLRDNELPLGNQAMQRFAQSCPMSLPAPSLCPFGGICHSCPPRVQSKLTVSQPGDEYEEEADRIADAVMRMPDPVLFGSNNKGGLVEQSNMTAICPACMDESHSKITTTRARTAKQIHRPLFKRSYSNCETEKSLPTEKLGNLAELGQPKTYSQYSHTITPQLESNMHALKSTGQSIPESIRAFFEPRFGCDFSRVRIHTDSQAARSAQTINAQAYVLDWHIVFDEGKYLPDTLTGKTLLAHELAHIVQKTSNTTPYRFFPGGHSDNQTQHFTPQYISPATLISRQEVSEEVVEFSTGTIQPSPEFIAQQCEADANKKHEKCVDDVTFACGLGGMVGAFGFGLAGAAVGSLILPGWGTAIGGAAGIAAAGGLAQLCLKNGKEACHQKRDERLRQCINMKMEAEIKSWTARE